MVRILNLNFQIFTCSHLNTAAFGEKSPHWTLICGFRYPLLHRNETENASTHRPIFTQEGIVILVSNQNR